MADNEIKDLPVDEELGLPNDTKINMPIDFDDMDMAEQLHWLRDNMGPILMKTYESGTLVLESNYPYTGVLGREYIPTGYFLNKFMGSPTFYLVSAIPEIPGDVLNPIITGNSSIQEILYVDYATHCDNVDNLGKITFTFTFSVKGF
jgi:hypothetical protein